MFVAMKIFFFSSFSLFFLKFIYKVNIDKPLALDSCKICKNLNKVYSQIRKQITVKKDNIEKLGIMFQDK